MNILKLEEILNNNDTGLERNEQLTSKTGDSDENDDSDESSASIPKQNSGNEIPRGKPKSRRIWKNRKNRFSSIVKTPGLKLSKEKKYLLRQELKNVKEHSRALLELRRQEKEQKRLRRQENLRRREENQRKSEIVQVIKNTAKLKRMKKKHLRKIEKRDTTKLLL